MTNTVKDKLSSIKKAIDQKWEEDIIPQLKEYITIPNKSPFFDANWEENGYMDEAMSLISHWCEQQPIKNMECQVLREPKRTPLLFIDIPGQGNDNVLIYGHMDKQPEMEGWDADKGPWQPVLKDHKLYGRGGADDGYSVFAALTAIALLQKHQIPHPPCQIIIEGSEESASLDLTFYLDRLQYRIGNPSLIICLDSGAGNYEQLWQTTSLRGIAAGELTIEVLTEGIHSGTGSGIVPSCSMILRQLLDRIENAHTGEVTLKELMVDIPKHRIEQAKITAQHLGDQVYKSYPFIKGVQPVSADITELLLNRSWRAKLSVIGIDGLPPIHNAGNVTLPKLTAKLSMRLPPSIDGDMASEVLKKTLEQDPPFNAKVTFNPEKAGSGWHAPKLSDWLAKASENASQLFYNKPTGFIGEGGTIPFMGLLGETYPEAQFLITGVLGPKSNAHGPNEFLHIPMVKNLTGCVMAVLESHCQHFNKK